jgi:hypothetical protein
VKHWLLIIGLAAYLGTEGARLYVYMPDWWADFCRFWLLWRR